MGDWRSTLWSGRFTPRKVPHYPLCRKLGGHLGCFECIGIVWSPLDFEPRTIQLVASHCTNHTIMATHHYSMTVQYFLTYT